MKGENKTQSVRRDLDPIEWAIIGTILAGVSVVASIQQIVDARASKTQEKAINSNRLKLHEIRQHLLLMQEFLTNLPRKYQLHHNVNETGISQRSILFKDEEEAVSFNEDFEESLSKVARVTRLITELDAKGFPLEQQQIDEYINFPLNHLKELFPAVLNPGNSPENRFYLAESILLRLQKFVRNLEVILDVPPSNPSTGPGGV
jgi:hypothetical protein